MPFPTYKPIQRQQTGSGFTNLQKILQANQQNKLGSTIAGGINQVGEATRSNINKAGQEFQSAAGTEKARQVGENQRISRVLGAPEAATDEDVKAFEGIRGGEYVGPKGLTNAGELASQAQAAGQLGQAVGSSGGRQGLLQRFASSGAKYTPGQQRLDALLLGQTGGDEQLRQARRSVSGLGNLEASKEQAASEVGKGLASGVQGLKENALNRLGESVSGYNTELEEKANQANLNRQAYIDQAKKNLSEGIADEKTMAALGLSEGTKVWDADLGQFLNLDAANLANKETIQSDQDYARINALSRLAGQSLQGDPSKYLEQFADKNLVGQFEKASPYQQINDKDVQAALMAREQAYNAEINPVMNPYNEANRAESELAGIASPNNTKNLLAALGKNQVGINQQSINELTMNSPQVNNVYTQLANDPNFRQMFPDLANQTPSNRESALRGAILNGSVRLTPTQQKMFDDASLEAVMNINAEHNPALWQQRLSAATPADIGQYDPTAALKAYQQQDIANDITKKYIDPAKEKYKFNNLLRKS